MSTRRGEAIIVKTNHVYDGIEKVRLDMNIIDRKHLISLVIVS